MALPEVKSKRVKTKDEIARAAKGDIPEFEFFTSDGSAVTLLMHNRNGRVLVNGMLHEGFYELCKDREQQLSDAMVDKFEILRIAEMLAAVDDDRAADEEGADAKLYETAVDKRNRIFGEHQAEVFDELDRLVKCAALGVKEFSRLQSGPIDRDFYYAALRFLVDVEDEAIPAEYYDEIRGEALSDGYQRQNFEDAKDFVDNFRRRVGL